MKNLRALLEDPQTTPELETAVQAETQSALTLLDTAALYATYAPGQGPAWVESLLAPSLDEESGKERTPIAVTLYVSTIGPRLEETLAQALAQGEGLRSRILTAVGEELAEQSGHFVSRLLAEEAKNDACDLSDRRLLPEVDQTQALLEALDAARIPIAYDAGGHLTPRFTRLGYVLWWPPAKKRK